MLVLALTFGVLHAAPRFPWDFLKSCLLFESEWAWLLPCKVVLGDKANMFSLLLICKWFLVLWVEASFYAETDLPVDHVFLDP